jgi:putative transposase
VILDHGTEFTSKALDEWAYRRGVDLDFIRPGKPVENAFIESFSGRPRDESRTCTPLNRSPTHNG